MPTDRRLDRQGIRRRVLPAASLRIQVVRVAMLRAAVFREPGFRVGIGGFGEHGVLSHHHRAYKQRAKDASLEGEECAFRGKKHKNPHFVIKCI